MSFNSFAPGRRGSNFYKYIFKLISRIDIFDIGLRLLPENPVDDIGSSSGLVSLGNKSLPESMFTQDYVAI